MSKQILVIGCGVSGLSCGIRLLEEGFSVKIIAKALPPHTTSNVAAAVWFPYKAYPFERVLHWSHVAYQTFLSLLDVPQAGVSMTTLIQLHDKPIPETPWWKEAVEVFRHSTADELGGLYKNGYTVQVPLIDTPIYISYLLHRFEALGGEIEQRTLHSFAEISADYPLIVNCTGLGAKLLANDEQLYPIKGQIVRIEPLDTNCSWVDEEGPLAVAYVIPRQNDCVLGGTAVDGDWDETVDMVEAQAIIQRCQTLVPEIAQKQVLGHLVGLRPGRKEIRLEAETISDTCTVIHNYGHGGAGVTVSWGCAEEVVQLILSAS